MFIAVLIVFCACVQITAQVPGVTSRPNDREAEYKLADGFLMRGEYRRDWSNQPFFLTEQPGVLKKEQNTATLGLIWWFGRKQGTW